MKTIISKSFLKRIALALSFLITTSVISQTITINPGVSYQSVTFGGDAKLTINRYAKGKTNSVSHKLFDEMKLKILRVPIFALQNINSPIYDDVIKVIKSVKAENRNVKIFASIANGDGYGTDYHGASKFPASWRGCCAYNVYSLNLTTYAAYLDRFMSKMKNAGITIDYLGPWNEDRADDSDHRKVFNQMKNLGSTKKVGLERWGLLTSISDVNDVEDRTDIIGSHFYDDIRISESNWDAKWSSLVSASADPVWYTEATRYKTNDNINNLVAGMDNIFPAIRGGAEAVIFYQACNRIVYANGGVPLIKYSGFKNIVNNAWGKVVNSYDNDSEIKVVTFGNNSRINVHILNTGTRNKSVAINLTNGYSAKGTVRRKIWTSSKTGATNSYNLNGNKKWNVTVNANSYSHLSIPLNKAVSRKISDNQLVSNDDFSTEFLGEFKVIPNPSNGNFQLNLPNDNNSEKITITLFSVDGRKMFSEVRNYENNISLNKNLPSGMYLVSASSGNTVYKDIIIIQ